MRCRHRSIGGYLTMNQGRLRKGRWSRNLAFDFERQLLHDRSLNWCRLRDHLPVFFGGHANESVEGCARGRYHGTDHQNKHRYCEPKFALIEHGCTAPAKTPTWARGSTRSETASKPRLPLRHKALHQDVWLWGAWDNLLNPPPEYFLAQAQLRSAKSHSL